MSKKEIPIDVLKSIIKIWLNRATDNVEEYADQELWNMHTYFEGKRDSLYNILEEIEDYESKNIEIKKVSPEIEEYRNRKRQVMTKLICIKDFKLRCDSLNLWVNVGDVIEHVDDHHLIFEVKEGKEEGLRFHMNLKDTLTNFVIYALEGAINEE